MISRTNRCRSHLIGEGGGSLDKPQLTLFKNPCNWKFLIINLPPGMHRNIHDSGKMRWGMTFEDSVVPWQHGEASFVPSLTLIAAAVGEGCRHRVLIKTTYDSSSFWADWELNSVCQGVGFFVGLINVRMSFIWFVVVSDFVRWTSFT
ncbi:hypothetical protein CDAR_62171 [Caerostris darwini]|uniref:Uncharacterized protein n=1 Tax=Caerostris darwini TaxID=1538125 RepID=A0AAV4MYI9_9ARAC|nr:hypothetical protein CDAR_62171 [Caerostris darwini]